jgi:lambda family phage portal protein
MSMREVVRQGVESRTAVDKVVEWFSPRAGLERLRHRTMLAAATGQGGHNAGRRDRRPTRNWRPPESSADADTLPDLPDLRARSRDLVRNTPLATGAVATTVTNVVGEGLLLQASIDHEALGLTEQQGDEWERAAEREWCHFCRTADFTRVQMFNELQVLAFRSVLESGDALVIRRYRKDVGDVYGTKIQLLEADRLSNPNRAADSDQIAGGVEVDSDGVPIAYHVSDRHPGALRAKALKWNKIAARTPQGEQVVIHLYDRMRPELTRGVPYLAPVIEHLKQLGDYSDAEVRAAVLTSYVTFFVERPLPDDPEDPKPLVGEKTSTDAANEATLGSGALLELGLGEKVSAPSPNRPNPQFDEFVQAFCRQIGVALELPFEILIKHFTASYSASRAALEMAWQFFRKRRSWLSSRLCQVVYEWVIAEAVATGRLSSPGYFQDPLIAQAYCGANWIGPNRASVDPLKEAKADETDIALGVKTREQVCLERTGGQIEKKTVQLGKEQAMRDAAGITPAPAPGGGQPAADDAEDESDDDTEDEAQPNRGRA